MIEGFSLSPQQERLWLLQRTAGGAAAFAAQCVVRIEGEASVETLRAAVDQVVARHEILRTSLLQVAGLKLPLQVIGERGAEWGDFLDLSGAADAAATLAELQRSEVQHGDGPEDAGPLRARLIALGEREHLLAVTAPAYCTDAVGLENLVREVALAIGGDLAAAAPPVPYAAIADWLAKLLESPEAEPGRQHWRKQDLGLLAKMKLPVTSLPAGARPRFQPESVPVPLQESAAQITALTTRHGVSRAALLLACWQALLGRMTGEPSLILGVLVEGRLDPDLEETVGLLARLVPVECSPGVEQPLLEAARSAQRALDESTDWQECFSWRDTSGSAGEPEAGPFFPFSFAWERPLGRYEAAGTSLSVVVRRAYPDRFTIQLRCRVDGALAGDLQYDSCTVSRGEAERMAARLGALVRSAVARPEAAVGDLDCFGADELRWLLYGLQGRAAAYPADLCLHELVERQTDRTPDAIALVAEDGALTFAELERRGNQLAHYLRLRGVGPDVPVALFLDRSLDLVVALLGTLKAGGAYVPIDPGFPIHRIATVLEDCAPPVVLTESRLAGRLPQGWPRLLLDAEHSTLARERAGRLTRQVGPDNLAYVLYTSGSTGTPKGVMVTHRGLCNHMLWMQEDYPLTVADRVLQKTPYVFDASVWELFSPLIAGAQLVLARPGGHRDSAYLVEALERHGITILQVVPALLRLLVAEPGFDRCTGLRRLYAGGEPLTGELVESLKKRLDCDLINLYGPTETSVQVTTWICSGSEASVPIGRPIANVRLYVVDPARRLVPFGVAGELLIGGAALGRGYLNRPDLAAERFVPDPMGGDSGARLYATGDLVRWRADGALEFLGRIDHQIKVRGFRVELGEIESALRRSPSVREAVVLPGGGAAVERLIAYVVPAAGVDLSLQDLRRFIESLLPDYMVPSVFMMLEAMPLLPSGKIDRGALTDPGDGGASAATELPRTVIEELVAAIWSDLLGIERIGVDDSLFDLGGHSLVATRIIARVRQSFEVEVPLQSFFRTPTVAGLAAEIERAHGRQKLMAPPLIPQPRGREVPLSFAQERLWLIDQLQPGGAAYNIPTAFILVGSLDVAALHAALQEVVRRHEVLRTTFVVCDGEPVQRIAAQASFELPQVDLAAAGEARAMVLARELATREAVRPFDLARGPLFRATLVRLGARCHGVLLAMHHIVSDGVSMELLIQEATSLYEAFPQGQASPLSQLPIQYADFALWQRQWLQGEILEEHLAYWRERLAGLPPVLELPLDRPRPPVQTYVGASHQLHLDEALSRALIRESRRQGVTPFMLLLTAFSVLLARHAGQDDIAVGTPVSGRDRVELEGLIGLFVNTLVLRVDLSGDPGFLSALAEVRRTVLDAHAHQDLPFERLVEELQPPRSLQHAPLFQVMMILGVSPRWPALPDLELLPLEFQAAASQFDLTLLLVQRDVLHLSIRYNTDLFDATSIARLAGHLSALLDGVIADPARPVSELPLLSLAERHHLLREWNDAAVTQPLVHTVDALIEQQAERSPESVAVVAGEVHLSYRELDRLAARLAGELVSLGIRPEARVGVLLERSAALLVALLGIWKAGGSYVPLDPTYPSERLAYMLEDSGAVALISEGELAAAVPGWTKPVIRLDGREVSALAAVSVPTAVMPPEALAYVIYTSGSTGRPKGVGITHRALANFLLAMSAQPGLTAKDRMLAVTSPSFDIAALELFLPLLVGARVVVAERDAVVDGERLFTDWERSGATILQATPRTWDALVEAGWPGLMAGRALCGGEAMPRPLASALAARASAAWNLYGPTESTVWSAAWRLDGSGDGTVSVGRPIANTEIYVLDEGLHAVPPGAFGEVTIGGEGVARGYLGRPDLTAELFVPDPFGDRPGARLYRTGDRGRLRPDGNLELVGRRDHQVKVRGYRIELGEVEAALISHPQVHETAVTVREDNPGDQRLVAYVAARGQAPGPGELRRFLAERLPLFMIPSAFVALPALPRTPNGKIDRRRLPAPDRGRPELEQAFATPRNETERRIAVVWQEVLGIERVGIHDNFFDLGGQSLLLARVHARLRQQPGGEQLAMIDLFRHPTIAALAQHVAPPGEANEANLPAAVVEDQIVRLQEGRRRQRAGRELRRRATDPVEPVQSDP